MSSNPPSLYNFSVKDVAGCQVSLNKYRSQVVIIVNISSSSGHTTENYTQLKTLQDKYYNRGLRIAAFPCNQFGGEEPDSAKEVEKFVREKFGYTPDMYGMVDVNGHNADPLFKWLKKEKSGPFFDAIKWNFSKFLINRKGQVVKSRRKSHKGRRKVAR